MKAVKFWKMEIHQLSPEERILFTNALETMLEWDFLKKECCELEFIKKLLESETNSEGFREDCKPITTSAIFANHHSRIKN